MEIKSRIDQVAGTKIEDSDYFDLSTAYGYGGYWTNSSDQEFLQKAMREFSRWCFEQNIIADFVRFHPLLFDATIFESEFSFFTRNNETVVVDLSLSAEERWSTYSSGTRNILRRCQRDLEVREASELDSFITLYYETMKRNAVGDFYYFDKTYFENLLEIDEVRLWEVSYDGELASAGFFMYSDDIGHYHLSANNSSLSKHNANYLLLEHAISYGRESGRKLLHLGGGRTPDPADGLFRFKKKFNPEGAVPFYIGGNVHKPRCI